MKVSWKYFLLAALVFLLAGCGRPPVESTPTTMTEPVTETTQPATDESEPASEPGIILVDHVSAVLTQLSRGDTVEILGEQENCYIVDSEKGQGLLEKRLVRTSGEANYETWTGYAKYGALLHQTYHLTDDGGVMSTNTKVQVLEDLIWCYLVQVEDTYGFVATDQISKQPLRSSSGSDEGGGNGGDVYVECVPPFEIYPDSPAAGAERAKSVIRARVADADELSAVYGKAVSGKEEETVSVTGEKKTVKNAVTLLEYYERPSARAPQAGA